MNHQQVQQILSNRDPIDAQTQQALAQHLVGCEQCSSFAQLATQLEQPRWYPHRKRELTLEQKHDLLARLAPQVHRNPMLRRSPYATWATAAAAFAVLILFAVYLFSINQPDDTVDPLEATQIVAIAEEFVTPTPTLALATPTLVPVVPTATDLLTAVPSATATSTPEPLVTATLEPTLSATAEPTTEPSPWLPTPTPLPKQEVLLVGFNERRRVQLLGGEWVATAVDKLGASGEFADHTVTVARIPEEITYTVYQLRENVGLGGLRVDLMHFSPDGRYFYFRLGTAVDGGGMFVDGGSIVRVDLSDGSTLELQNLSGNGHVFDAERVVFVRFNTLVVHDFATEQQQQFELSESQDNNSSYGGLVWNPDNSAEIAITGAFGAFTNDWTQGLFMLNIETGDVTTLIEPIVELQSFQSVAWYDGIITLTYPREVRGYQFDVASGQLTRP